MHAVSDIDASAGLLEGAGAHGLVGDEEIVQPRGTREAGVIRGVEDRGGVFKLRLGVVQREILAEALGRDTRPAPEQALEVMRAEADRLRHRAQLRLIAKVRLQIEDRSLDAGVIAGVTCDVRGCGCHGVPPEPPHYEACRHAATRLLRSS